MIHNTIKEEIKKSMIARDVLRLETMRGLSAMMTNDLVARGKTPQDTLADEEALAVIRRAAKQRKDSIEQFDRGGRSDLSEKEKAELDILESFLPKTMSREEIRKIAETKKSELGFTDRSKLGSFIGVLMKDLKGKADGADVKAIVEEIIV